MPALVAYMNDTLDALYRADLASFRAYSWSMVGEHYRTVAWQCGKVVQVVLADGTVIGECYPSGASHLF